MLALLSGLWHVSMCGHIFSDGMGSEKLGGIFVPPKKGYIMCEKRLLVNIMIGKSNVFDQGSHITWQIG